MYLSGLDRMDRAGYVQYEISNVSRPGRASRHNLKYWTDGEWQGFGCGAHSTRYIGGLGPGASGDGPFRGLARWKNLPSAGDYIDAVTHGRSPVVERREVSADERLEEALFTGLRLNRGLDLEDVQSKYGVDVWRRFGEELQVFVDERLLIYDGGSLRLSRPGMLLANEVMAVFIRSTVR
jgi:oxygen-independent coproporphyrinogen-3 oxidase